MLIEPLPTVKIVPFDSSDSSAERLIELLVLELLVLFVGLIFSGMAVLAFVFVFALALVFAFSAAEELRLIFPEVVLFDVTL